MKKIILGTLMLAGIVTSCEKEEVTVDDASKSSVENTETNYRAINTKKNYIEDNSNPGMNVGRCVGVGENCIVNSYRRDLLDQCQLVFNNVINNEEGIIEETFIANHEFLVTYVDVKYVDGVINGEFVVKNNGVPSEESPAYLKFYDREDNFLMAYEFSIEE